MLLTYDFGQEFQLNLLLKTMTEGTAKNGKKFLTIELEDKSGFLTGKIWEDDLVSFKTSFSVGNVLNVQGRIEEYSNQKQIKLIKWFMSDDQNIENYTKTAPKSGNLYVQQIYNVIGQMTNTYIQNVTGHLVKLFEEKLIYRPAAIRHHHAYIGGLAYHTVSMLNIAERFIRMYPILNKDLLYAGIILHDLGKITEYKETISQHTLEFSLEGELSSHITIMSELIENAKQIYVHPDDAKGNETILLLKHMVLSHHGKLEWGSPVVPKIPEAEALHQIDKIDATMDKLTQLLENVPIGEFSAKEFSLENRKFYKHDLNEPVYVETNNSPHNIQQNNQF